MNRRALLGGALLGIPTVTAQQRPTLEDLYRNSEAQRDAAVIEAAQRREAKRQAGELRQRYAELVAALNRFAERYNETGGEALLSKEAAAVNKAMDALVRSDAWPVRR